MDRPGPLDGTVRTRDGRLLHTLGIGRGDDLVVLEAGLGVSGVSWAPVQEALVRLSPHASVLAYERAGYGSSDEDSSSRTLDRLASDLIDVLDALRWRRLILVGHSWGGPIVRVVAERCAERSVPVHAVVLVDPSDEHAADLYCSRVARSAFAVQAALTPALARARMLAPLVRRMLVGLPRNLQDGVLRASSSPAAARASAAEARQVPRGIEALVARPPVLGREVQLSVISGSLATWQDRRVRRRLASAHRQSVAAHPGGRFVSAERSGHLVPFTEPDLVAREVARLLG